MEFKMLSSQINPHFLYNTLETIRMKAFTAGDREVATAIKLLGKSMRYVLENTGTTVTTLREEIAHVENYMQIQKLRFGTHGESILRTRTPTVRLTTTRCGRASQQTLVLTLRQTGETTQETLISTSALTR